MLRVGDASVFPLSAIAGHDALIGGVMAFGDERMLSGHDLTATRASGASEPKYKAETAA